MQFYENVGVLRRSLESWYISLFLVLLITVISSLISFRTMVLSKQNNIYDITIYDIDLSYLHTIRELD